MLNKNQPSVWDKRKHYIIIDNSKRPALNFHSFNYDKDMFNGHFLQEATPVHFPSLKLAKIVLNDYGGKKSKIKTIKAKNKF